MLVPGNAEGQNGPVPARHRTRAVPNRLGCSVLRAPKDARVCVTQSRFIHFSPIPLHLSVPLAPRYSQDCHTQHFGARRQPQEREIFIDSLLVRVHLIIEMSRPALRHGSLNSPFQIASYLPSSPNRPAAKRGMWVAIRTRRMFAL
jgi:hypothetical protein